MSSELVEYAKSELERIGKDEDGLQDLINRDILEIVKTFSSQGHSNHSAMYAIHMIERLLRWKPIEPLTGEDSEWGTEAGPDQNKRCNSVFKKTDGTYIDIDAIIVSYDGGLNWCSVAKNITFPYVPPIEPERVYIEYKDNLEHIYVDYENDESYDVITNNPERIKNLRERKIKEYENIDYILSTNVMHQEENNLSA